MRKPLRNSPNPCDRRICWFWVCGLPFDNDTWVAVLGLTPTVLLIADALDAIIRSARATAVAEYIFIGFRFAAFAAPTADPGALSHQPGTRRTVVPPRIGRTETRLVLGATSAVQTSPGTCCCP